jgi:7-cyano-7-deazaguanine tRNA-ribosyltransferase
MQDDCLEKIRCIADYQFGQGIGKMFFPSDVRVSISRRTGRVRHIWLDGELLATLRPSNGLFALTIEGARRIYCSSPNKFWVEIQDNVTDFAERGKSVFARHVVDCDSEIRPGEEVIVIDSKSRVLAVGKAVLSGEEMKAFKKGVAVRVRSGITKKRSEILENNEDHLGADKICPKE